MTADRDKTENPAPASVQVDVAAPTPLISRRMLLRGASAAVPTILTLNSGVAAAAAATSNLIAINPGAGPETFKGQYGHMCLQFDQGMSAAGSKINLGDRPMGAVTVLPPGEYRLHQSGDNLALNDVCTAKYGDTFEFKPDGGGGWRTVRVPPGGLLSNAALTSFSAVLTPQSLINL